MMYCDFSGISEKAKCDFAIPGRELSKVIIESGYTATGSKMTDIIGDLEKK